MVKQGLQSKHLLRTHTVAQNTNVYIETRLQLKSWLWYIPFSVGPAKALEATQFNTENTVRARVLRIQVHHNTYHDKTVNRKQS